MLARSSGAARTRRGFTFWRKALVVALLAPAVACDRVPLTAPTESTITLFTTGPSVPVNGSVDIVATVVEEAGTPVHNGTVVTFTTTLGRIDPVEARTHNGSVTVRLNGDGRSGLATVTAFSGGAVSEGLEVPIGAAAAETIVVRAEPASVPIDGGGVQIVALVRDASGNAVTGVPVSFRATAGQLSPATATTDQNGEARTTLTTATESTVTATAGAQSGEVTVGVAVLPTIALSASPTAPNVGQPVTFTVNVTVPNGASRVRNVRLSFGDGDFEDLGAVTGSTTASHVYGDDGSYTVTATVTDAAGQQTSQSLVISVLPASPIGVNVLVSGSLTVNGVVIFTAVATPPAGVVVERYDWAWSDGVTRSTTGTSTTRTFTTGGSRSVTVTAIGSNGASGTGRADFFIATAP